MTAPRLRLRQTPWRLAVCRFPADAPIPAWTLHADARFWSITRTPDELSVVCGEDDLPPSVDRHVEGGWRALQVVGPLPFDLTGVVSGVTSPLAAAGVWFQDERERINRDTEGGRLTVLNAQDTHAAAKLQGATPKT